jgi:hypothetical protein
MVFDLERMLLGNGVDSHLGVLELSKSHIDPHIFEYIRKLAEELEDPFQSVGEESVNTVFNGVFIPHVADEDLVPPLTYTLDAAFALCQASRIPGKVQINEGAKTLEI